MKDSVKQFRNNEDVYRAIGYTVKLIDDGHSIFLTAGTPNAMTIDTLPIPDLTAKIVEGNIGYVKLTGFVANRRNSNIYSRRIRKSLYELDSATDISGWIVDLRKNVGGLRSMMPLGLTPLFQDSLVAYTINNKSEYLAEYCTNKFYYLGNQKVDSMDINLGLINKHKSIAVLVSNKTVSAGETLASALRSQPSTRLFGEPTYGKTSGLQLITFVSDAKFLLAANYLCTTNKEVIYNGLIPDIECDPDEAFKLAIDWISEGHIANTKNIY